MHDENGVIKICRVAVQPCQLMWMLLEPVILDFCRGGQLFALRRPTRANRRDVEGMVVMYQQSLYRKE